MPPRPAMTAVASGRSANSAGTSVSSGRWTLGTTHRRHHGETSVRHQDRRQQCLTGHHLDPQQGLASHSRHHAQQVCVEGKFVNMPTPHPPLHVSHLYRVSRRCRGTAIDTEAMAQTARRRLRCLRCMMVAPPRQCLRSQSLHLACSHRVKCLSFAKRTTKTPATQRPRTWRVHPPRSSTLGALAPTVSKASCVGYPGTNSHWT